MMSEKQYRVACGGVKEQIKVAKRLHCPHMEARYKAALAKLQRSFMKPDLVGRNYLNINKNLNTTSYYHL